MKTPSSRQHVTEQYAKIAADYDARWSRYVAATTDATIERLPDSPGDVLDVGCGTGVLLARLQQMRSCSQITGVDASTEMLDIARSRLPLNIELYESWAEELPFEDATFDTIVSCSMFHFIRNPQAAVDEMFRVLRPTGTLLISDWCADFWTVKGLDIYLRWFDRSHFRTHTKSKLHAILAAAGARAILIDKYKISPLWGLMTATVSRPPASPRTGDRPG